eukprot:9311112-Alexandrium_andersonii.AAC.1
MSASLVGSEMCIRDRGPGGGPAAGAAAAAHSAEARPVAEPGQLVGVEAVSYTHLTLPTICSV